jgi:archaellum component FlaC
MAEKTTVAFRVDESVKEEWEDAAELPEYDSLSHLIRLSVQKEITETEGEEPNTRGSDGADGGAEVLESLNRVERTVESIQDEVEAVGRENRAGELYDLEQVLLEILPAFSDPIDQVVGTDLERLESAAATPRGIAGRIGADTSDVESALERLEENVGQVQVMTNGNDGKTLYWRKE